MYNKTNWVNDSEPALSAENLNKMEQGIYDAQFEKFTDTGPSDSIVSLLFTANDPDPAELVGKIIGITSARRQENDEPVTLYVSKIGAGGLTIPLTLFDRTGNETTTMRAGQRAENQLMLIYIASETKAYYLNPIDTGYTANESDQLYANALTGTGAGRMVSLTDVAPRAALSECTIQGQTTETGEGDKGPDNPYTITGATPTKLTVCGKNLFDPVGQFNALYAYADTYTGSGDMHPVNEIYLGRAAVKCQARTLAQGSNSVYYFLQDCFEPNTQYTFSFDWAYDKQIPDAPTNTGYYFRIEYTDGSYLMPLLGSASQTVEWRHKKVTSGTGKTIKNVSFSWGSAAVSIYLDFNTFQIERGAIETAYTPYVGTEYPVSPSGALHCLTGGAPDTLDAAAGKLTRYVASVTYNGTESWTRTTNGATDANNFFYAAGIPRDETVSPICNYFVHRNINVGETNVGFFTTQTVTRFRPDMSQFPDVATWKSWLAEHPVTIYYQLAEPTVTNITPKRMVPPAPDATIYPDAGNVLVGYNRDINIALQTISNAVIALGGGV